MRGKLEANILSEAEQILQEMQGHSPILLDRVVLTPDGIQYLPIGYTAALATWSGKVLNALAAVYAGVINDVLINKGETGVKSVFSAPATVKADGQTFEIYVDATNNSSARIVTGVEVIVTKPDGSKVAPAINWMDLGQGVGTRNRWSYNIAAVNLVGNWSAVITYYAK